MLKTKNPIDWARCLARCNNNIDIAQDLLNMLAKDIPQLKAAILNAHKQKATQDLCHHIHKLNGACACCGAHDLQTQAAKLETQLSQNNAELKQSQLNNFILEMDHVLTAITTRTYID